MEGKCWIPSKSNVWELGEIVQDLGDGNYVVDTASESQKTFNKSVIGRHDPTHDVDNEDLCTMNQLHEGPLLDCLRRRFTKDSIYTTTGDVLISVNPYKNIPGLYDSILTYLDISEDGDIERYASKPHVFKIANAALVSMLYGKRGLYEDSEARNQSVIVSGESGAGKTEASKYVMNFLIAADEEVKVAAAAGDRLQASQLGEAIRKVLLDSNIIFEAFGNAKTVRNDNSSRFGKYIKLQYSRENALMSAFSETFLLEKSRLTTVGQGERNYHVFYMLLAGLSRSHPILAEQLHLPREGLQQAGQFSMLIDSDGSVQSSEMDDLWLDLLIALATLGCSEDEVQAICSLLAALLHLGNLKPSLFDQPVQLTGSEATEVKVDAADAKRATVGHAQIACSSIPLPALAALLGLPSATFVAKLVTQRVQASNRRSVTVKQLSVVEIQNNIAALIKFLYSSLFYWLVDKINYKHCSVATAGSLSSSVSSKAVKFTGILDIFGFEILANNSFEQLCINFANERLQQQFNETVFDREQAIYRAEGLDWTAIAYRDNQAVIDLIGKKPSGLLFILEQQGMLNRGSVDEGPLLAAFNATHAANNQTKHPNYERSRFGNDGKFTVRHFAGEVGYSCKGFLDKNNDSLQEDLLEMLLTSTSVFLQTAVLGATGTGTGGEGQGDGRPGYIPPIDEAMMVQLTAASATITSTKAPGSSLSSHSARRGSVAVTLVESQQQQSSNNNQGNSSTRKMANSATVSVQFRQQLDLLLLQLRQTSPHYIKCIKPNADKQASRFTSDMVMEQLKYSGVLEVVRIRREGFPISLAVEAFYAVFLQLAFDDLKKAGWRSPALCTADEAKGYTASLCRRYLTEKLDYQIGLTKVFLRAEAYEKMQLALASYLGLKLAPVQALVRGRSRQRRYEQTLAGFKGFQGIIRGLLQRKRYKVRLAAHHKQMQRLAEEKRRREAEERRLAEEQRRREAEQRRLEEEQRRQAELARLKVEAENARVAEEERQRLLAEQRRMVEEERARLAAEEQAREAERQRLAELARLEQEQAMEIQRLALLEAQQREEQRLKEEEETRQAALAYARRIEQLHRSCVEGDLAVVSEHLSLHPEDYETRDNSPGQGQFNCTVLQSAARSGSLHLVCYLLPSRDELFIKDQLGQNALHHAVLGGKTGCLAVLRLFAAINAGDMAAVNEHMAEFRSLGMACRPSSSAMSTAATSDNKANRYLSMATAQATAFPTPSEEEQAMANQLEQKGGGGGKGAAGGGAVELKAGWLSKRGESQTWRRRYVRLTSEALMYFRNEKDKLPRDTLSFSHRNDLVIQRDPKKKTGIEIAINHQSTVKKRDKIALMAETEQEMQAWLTLLKAAAAIEVKPLRASRVAASSAVSTVSPARSSNSSSSLPPPMIILRPTWTGLMLRLVNQRYETPLHLLCAYDPPSDEQAAAAGLMTEDDTLVLALWMLANHAPLNSSSSQQQGVSPLQVAVNKGHQRLAALLLRQGADPSQTGKRDSQLAAAAGSDFAQLLKEAVKTFEQRELSFVKQPVHLSGYHYLSLLFYRSYLSPQETAAARYALRVTTCNGHELLVEPSQLSPPPSVSAASASRSSSSSTCCWLWLEQFHLLSPLDNLEDGSYLLIDLVLRPKQGSQQVVVVATHRLALDRATITSAVMDRVPLYSPVSSSSEGGAAASAAPRTVHSTLDLEVVISKR